MIPDKPTTGYGYGFFEKHYNLKQAEYFEQGKSTEQEKRNAGYVRMAYNEYLENFIEGGFVGFLFFTGLLIVLLMKPKKTEGKRHVNTEKKLNSNLSSKLETITAYAGIAAFAFMSAVNFTIQAIPVFYLFIFYTSVLAVNNANRFETTLHFLVSGTKWKMGLGLIIMVCGIFLLKSQLLQAIANYNCQCAFKSATKSKIHEALNTFRLAETKLCDYNSFLQKYGLLLFSQGKYEGALEQFEKAKKLSSNSELFRQTGKCYEALRNYKQAEKEYLNLKNMEPGYVTPRYLLMKMYLSKGDTGRAIETANQILSLPLTKWSPQIDQYKKEATWYLQLKGEKSKIISTYLMNAK